MNSKDSAKILIVDDQIHALQGVSRIMRAAGYEVLAASNGTDCLRLAAEHKPDLILLDVVLPDIDGREVCKRIKSDPEIANIYVVLLSSTLVESDSQAEGLEHGADGYIARPIPNRELLARVKSILRLKLAESRLRDSEATLRSLIENAPIAMIMTSGVKQTVEMVNQEFTKLFGYTRKDVPDIDHWWPLACPEGNHWRESAAGWNQKVDSAIRSESKIKPVKTVVKCKDGSSRYIEVRFSSIGHRNMIFFTDLTERRFAEEETLKTKALLDSIIQNLPTGVFVKDAKRLSFSIWNKTCEDLYGYMAGEMIGKTAKDIFTEAEAERFEAQDRHVLTSGQLVEIQEQEVATRDKGVRILRSKKVPIIDEKGKASHVVGISEDITELKIAEKQLISAREAAEQASRAKSSFLANMSHEIRTPMNGIIGMTELALNTDITSEQREYLEAVKISAESLLRLINDILDFSKIEAGKFELVEMDFSLRDSIAQAMIAVSLQAHSKDLELVYHIPPQIPDVVAGDPGRLNQILINLLGNAIKFTHKGEVSVDVELESESEDEMRLHLSIKDTGIGIPKEKQEKIFNAFEQADGSTTRKYGGTGLGLAVSTQLVQMMGGQIWLESEVGTGSTFHFTTKLGVSRRPLPKSVPVDFSEFKDLPVLIVDDNAMNRFVLKEILTYWGMRPVAVESATDALKTMKSAQELGQPFQLVILDYLMPDMDGFELAERIKQDHTLSGVTMIMLTSAGQRGDARRCMNLGITAYCLKPIKQSELFAIISRALNKSSEGEKRPSLVTRHSVREVKRCLSVLLAEDNAINQKLATRILEKMGHTVTIAENGREALHILENARFDIVLMDVQMPEMDGFEATRSIREKERITGGHIPIVAMTAHAMAGDREKCLAVGMDGYVSKPINTKELVENIERLVGKREAASEAPSSAGKGGDIVDRTQLLARVGDDVDLLGELVDLFLDTGGQMLSDVECSVRQGNAEGIERAAHTIKGAVGNFAADRAFEAALKLETMGREGAIKHTGRAFKDLEKEINLFTDVLVSLKKDNFQDILLCH